MIGPGDLVRDLSGRGRPLLHVISVMPNGRVLLTSGALAMPNRLALVRSACADTDEAAR